MIKCNFAMEGLEALKIKDLLTAFGVMVPHMSEGDVYKINYKLDTNGWEEACNKMRTLTRIIHAGKIQELTFEKWDRGISILGQLTEVMQSMHDLYSTLERWKPPVLPKLTRWQRVKAWIRRKVRW